MENAMQEKVDLFIKSCGVDKLSGMNGSSCFRDVAVL